MNAVRSVCAAGETATSTTHIVAGRGWWAWLMLHIDTQQHSATGIPR